MGGPLTRAQSRDKTLKAYLANLPPVSLPLLLRYVGQQRELLGLQSKWESKHFSEYIRARYEYSYPSLKSACSSRETDVNT